jgi:hypothetical protein
MKFRLWGKGNRAEDQPKDESDEEKAAREKAEKEESERKAEEDRKAKEAAASDEDEEDEEDEDEDEATKAAAAAVPAKVRASIARSAVRADRSRIHAIVDGGGRDRVETSLQLALGTDLTAKAALAIVATTASGASSAPVPAGGVLGLGGEMATRRQQTLGPDTGGDKGPAGEVDRAAAFVLKAGKV